MSVSVPIRVLEGNEDLPLPEYQTELAAAVDLCAAVTSDVTLAPSERTLVPCGFAMALPAGYEAQVRPRSGLAVKHGITVLNSPGTIDADYRGEIGVPLINLGNEPFVITRGLRVAQMVVAPVARVEWDRSEELAATQRGAGGFGHTGVS